MKWIQLLVFSLLVNFECSQFLSSRKRKKQKYKVVTPAPVCIERQESVFSVTGFLTFVVVASTAVANVIANIDNNNNNNNNNDNNDNVNNNNQISDSADAQNMGNARSLTDSVEESRKSLLGQVCLPFLICQFFKDEQGKDSTTSRAALVSGLTAFMVIADNNCFDPLEVLSILRKSEVSPSCEEFSC